MHPKIRVIILISNVGAALVEIGVGDGDELPNSVTG